MRAEDKIAAITQQEELLRKVSPYGVYWVCRWLVLVCFSEQEQMAADTCTTGLKSATCAEQLFAVLANCL